MFNLSKQVDIPQLGLNSQGMFTTNGEAQTPDIGLATLTGLKTVVESHGFDSDTACKSDLTLCQAGTEIRKGGWMMNANQTPIILGSTSDLPGDADKHKNSLRSSQAYAVAGVTDPQARK